MHRAYHFWLLTFIAMVSGGIYGFYFNSHIVYLKPIATIFLNLLLTAIVPLVFFSVASSMVLLGKNKVANLLSTVIVTFLLFGIFASLYMLIFMEVFPPHATSSITLSKAAIAKTVFSKQVVYLFSVPDFINLFSHKNLLPLIIFAGLIGTACAKTDNHKQSFTQFLSAGVDIFTQVTKYIMLLAPLGFFAFFAVLAGEVGPALLGQYMQVTVIYYVAAILYFFVITGFYSYFCLNINERKLFWREIKLPSLTALGTCSSAASIPTSIQAVKAMGTSPIIYQSILPLGAILHKQGSILGAVVKIAFVFAIFKLNFNQGFVLLSTIMLSQLVGSVMGAIPTGGMIGELLILYWFGFPYEALMAIAAISLIIDPIATLINVVGNILCTLIIDKRMKSSS